MASSASQYPDHLNPFGSDDEDEARVCQSNGTRSSVVINTIQYPDHLDPFSTDDTPVENEPNSDSICADDYDDSLNPFNLNQEEESSILVDSSRDDQKPLETGPTDPSNDEGNPFAEKLDEGEEQQEDAESKSSNQKDESIVTQRSPSPELTEPPKPLPRTKSLLKKEQAHKKRLQEQQIITDHQAHSLQSTTSSTTSSSSTAEANIQHTTNILGTFQRQKNKRLAPPVPINFKRQVSGSLDAIEDELNDIGDKLSIIEKESIICQKTLTSGDTIDETAMQTTRCKFVELIKRRNSIVRRQKELMYKKRELKLDQLYSDIEYELRMIGNKQQSTRTTEDGLREKELLKKLVEIVEEKNDIVENLNKDTSCDSRDVEEAFKRLNISDHAHDGSDKRHANNSTAQIVSKGETCDKKGLARLSKIATLLPRSDTIKMKRIDGYTDRPCICNSTFYQNCPPRANCMENPRWDDEPKDYDEQQEISKISEKFAIPTSKVKQIAEAALQVAVENLVPMAENQVTGGRDIPSFEEKMREISVRTKVPLHKTTQVALSMMESIIGRISGRGARCRTSGGGAKCWPWPPRPTRPPWPPRPTWPPWPPKSTSRPFPTRDPFPTRPTRPPPRPPTRPPEPTTPKPTTQKPTMPGPPKPTELPGLVNITVKPYPAPPSPPLHDPEDPDHVPLPEVGPIWYSTRGPRPPFWPRPKPPLSATREPFRPPVKPSLWRDGTALNSKEPVPLSLSSDQEGKIVRHRKVYLKQRPKSEGDVPIHPINIRIPVRAPEYVEPRLPPPEPMFKLKKYTTYETKPEVQMVPIKKTIIKPVGIRPDQIIDEANSGDDKKSLLYGDG